MHVLCNFLSNDDMRFLLFAGTTFSMGANQDLSVEDDDYALECCVVLDTDTPKELSVHQ